MHQIIGSSFEKVVLKDLGDVIYYKQKKYYTDQQYETSIDLQKEIRKGRLTYLGNYTSPANSADTGGEHLTINQSSLSIGDIKTAIREIMGLGQSKTEISGNDLRNAMREITPMLMDTLRQELASKLSTISVGKGLEEKRPEFIGPEYIPDISTADMISNIKVEAQTVSGNTVNDNLAALRRLKQK